MLRGNQQLKGLPLPNGEQIVSSAFVDDTAAITEICSSGHAIGASGIRDVRRSEGNWYKSVALPAAAQNEQRFFDGTQIQSAGDPMMYLGILMPGVLINGTQLEERIRLAIRRLERWGRQTKAGVFGRVLIVNTCTSNMPGLWQRKLPEHCKGAIPAASERGSERTIEEEHMPTEVEGPYRTATPVSDELAGASESALTGEESGRVDRANFGTDRQEEWMEEEGREEPGMPM
ncbi:hypothetical protein CBR_g55303 [Chara braunii]|uniref:Uncharacterized protein n=1 Tax=Chara braunii TaxID=69332 RepID=A0A388MCV4_CHABU|nr:hypothetical protein CBR_g55303 [Chara braunii]|eukprot:GBG92396.1 hypothetical protein CBR_g55303 [Chara braunii]